MEGSSSKSDNKSTAPSCGMEENYIKPLGAALEKLISMKGSKLGKHSIPTINRAFKTHFGKNLNNKQDDKDLITQSFASFLEDINGLLIAVDLSTKICTFAKCSSKLSAKKMDSVGKRLESLVHSEDHKYFNKNSHLLAQPAHKDTQRGFPPAGFTSRFKIAPSSGETSSGKSTDDYMPMECIGFVNNFKDSINSKPEGNDYFICLATTPCTSVSVDTTTRGPPNQTINTRVEIPQPQRFYTRQNVKGDITAIHTDQVRHLVKGKPQIPVEMKEVIDRCLKSFMEPRHNGSSLQQILHKQVLSQGQATSPAHKFQLTDGTTATSLTKSKLMGNNRGEPPFVMSIHSIYRDGSLNNLDLQRLPSSIRSILSGPVVIETTSSCESVTTPTTTSLATTSSFSSEQFLTTNRYRSKTMNGDFMGETSFSSWQIPNNLRPRNSLEVAKELLACTGAEQNIAGVNGVVSPPPHLDGHLVHAVGGHKKTAHINNFITSVTNMPFKVDPLNNNPTILNNIEVPGITDNTNPATYPGPPCIDLSRFEISSQDGSLIPTPSPSVTSTFVNGITTMRKEAAVTTTTCKVLSSGEGKMVVDDNNNVCPPDKTTKRVCTPPEKTSSLYKPIPPSSRPRSASTNNTPPCDNPLKRSASTLSQDSGIAEVNVKVKPIPVQRKLNKSKGAQKHNKLLSKILCSSKQTDDELLSAAIGKLPSNDDMMGNISPIFSSPTSGIMLSSPPAIAEQKNNLSLSLQNPCNPFQNSVASEATSFSMPSGVINNKPTSNTSKKYSVSTSVSAEEMQELHDILDSIDSVFPMNEQQASTDGYSSNFNPQMNNINQTRNNLPQTPMMGNISGNNQIPMQIAQHIQEPIMNHDNMMTSPIQTNQSMIGTPQQMTLQGQNFNGLVPTGLEMCPNRVVSTAGVVSPCVHQAPTVPPYPDFGAPENWEGDEPLVDLGAFPPPAGINPRMTIPIPPSMNSTINGGNNIKMRPNNLPNMQNGMNRMMFHNPQSRITQNGPIENLQMHQNSSMMTASVSPGNFSSVSPNNFTSIRPNVIGNTRQIYDNRNMNLTNGGNIRASLLRQQMRPVQSSFNGDMGITGGIPQYNPVQSDVRLMRRNENIIKQRKLIEQKPELQRALSSPNGQNVYGSLNSPRFVSNQTPPFSPLKSPGYSPINPMQMADEYLPMSFNPALRPTNTMTGQQPIRFNGGMGGAYNNMTSMVVTNQQSPQSNVAMTTAVTKPPPLKRSRSRKPRKNSKKSTEDTSWEDMTSNVYKQRPLFQMTIGDFRQRPQTTFNSSLDGAIPTPSSLESIVTSQNNQQQQTLNLNSLLQRYQQKVKPGNNNEEYPVTSSAWPDSGEFKGVSDVTGSMTSQSFTSGMLTSMVGDSSNPNSLPPHNGLPTNSLNEESMFLPTIGPSANDVTMNTNVNNNKTSNYVTHCRYTASVASAAILPHSDDMTSPGTTSDNNASKRFAKRKTSLLESLLLSKD